MNKRAFGPAQKQEDTENILQNGVKCGADEQRICNLCPRDCSAVRAETKGGGVCGMGMLPVVARAAAHMWEEPCLVGERGSGTVFFSGCTLKCVFCQNKEISRGMAGKAVTPGELRDIFLRLCDKGVHNINLVTPSHFADSIAEALHGGLPVPVVYNCGGYESVETLKKLEGLIDIYMPDMKYALAEPAAKYSKAADYPLVAMSAIEEMYRQTGDYIFGEDGTLKKGVIIRHLVLPENLENTFCVIDWIERTFRKGQVLFSLMSQYTPVQETPYPELNRPLSEPEHRAAIRYLKGSAIEDGFYQDLGSVNESFIPPFDLTGI